MKHIDVLFELLHLLMRLEMSGSKKNELKVSIVKKMREELNSLLTYYSEVK